MKTHWLTFAFKVILIAIPVEQSTAQDLISVRVYSSTIAGVPDSFARDKGKILTDYISRKLRVPVELEIYHGNTPSDLKAFGKKLDDGQIDFGVTWGIEYGWLTRLYNYRNLEPVIVYMPDKDALVKAQVLVGRGVDGSDTKSLEGKRLANYPGASLADRLFLEQFLKMDQQRFFGEKITTYENFSEAARAVHRGDADCVVVGVPVFARLRRGQPNLKLREFASSRVFAPAVLVGCRDVVEKKSRGRWQAMVQALSTAHLSDEVNEFCNFWRIEKLCEPNSDFDAIVKQNVEDFPITAIGELAGRN